MTMVEKPDRYPDVTLEEAERLFQYLQEFDGFSLADIASSINEPYVADPDTEEGRALLERVGARYALTKSIYLYACLNWLFLRVEDWKPDYQAKFGPWKPALRWEELPEWVLELYERASSCEQNNASVL
jgi:hypothetical protein